MRQLIITAACARGLSPPVGRIEPVEVRFGAVAGENRGPKAMSPVKTLSDPYFWLRDDERSSPEVLGLLEQENAYTVAKTAHLDSFRQHLYEELLSHVQEADETVPHEGPGGSSYSTRTVEGLAYKQYVRDQEVFFDVNELAQSCAKPSMVDVSRVEVSPSGELFAFTFDESGSEKYEIRIRKDGVDVDVIKDTSGSMCWGRDDSDLYFVRQDAALRPYQCWRRRRGCPDELIFEEPDEGFIVSVGRENDGTVLIRSASKETTEVWLAEETRVVRPRKTGVQYAVASQNDRLFITSNKDGVNRALYEAAKTAPDVWTELVAASDARSLTGQILAFADSVVVTGRENGFTQIWRWQNGSFRPIFEDNSAKTASLGVNLKFDGALRVTTSSMTTPRTTMDDQKVLKVDPVPNYDPSLYATKRVECSARDGTRVPITLLWRKDVPLKGIHLYGYGSYGISIDPSFSALRLPLVDRGLVYAIAHVRGGGEMGKYTWYESSGKYLSKRNTFFDFIDCAEHLRSLYPDLGMSIEGRSAGGLLVGNALNLAPSMFKACIAGVPFVDLMCTMCDPSIPLTTEEWFEWGNPNQAEYFDYMLSYSPINNVQKGVRYPPTLIVAGLNDPRVAYWEPAKWAQVLRSKISNGDDILLKMDLDAGHFSAADRYSYLRMLAFDYAWLLDRHGLVAF